MRKFVAALLAVVMVFALTGVIGANENVVHAANENPFKDISEGQYYYQPVLWAVNNKVTAGLSADEFAPNALCTRGQVITFIWRANGCPEPKSLSTEFTDIHSWDYYYKAVLWAVEKGIASGSTATTFSPNAEATRGQIVTFLYRAANKPTVNVTTCNFEDVVKGAYYYNAVLWAVENKITSGTSATTFEPDAFCTRGQVVTFLYRAFEKNEVVKELKVGVFYYTFSDTYLASVRGALDAEFTSVGIEFLNYDALNSQTTQFEQIDAAIKYGVNLLIVNVVSSGNPDVSQEIVEKAKDAGIPVIFFNRAVEADGEEGAVLSTYDNCAFVGTDPKEAGRAQGKMIGDFLLANYDEVDLNGDGTISYAMFMGDSGNEEAIYRTKYGQEDADAVLTSAGKPALKYFDALNSDKYQADPDGAWTARAAYEYMSVNLVQYNETNGNMIELVICNNDGMAEGAIIALQDVGYNCGNDGKTIPVFGIDGIDYAKALIAAGSMTGTIEQDFEGIAAQICDLAENVAAGKTLMDGVAADRISEAVANKIYIPYATYMGE